MREIDVRDDLIVTYDIIQDGEAIILTVEDTLGENKSVEAKEKVVSEIILLRPLALQLAKIIQENMVEDEKK